MSLTQKITEAKTKLQEITRVSGLLAQTKAWRHPVFRNYQGLFNYFFGKAGDSPIGVQADIIRACNFSCDYCLVHADKSVADGKTKMLPEGYGAGKQPAIMEYETFTKLVDDNPKAVIVQLQGQGEPTFHPQLEDMIRYAKDTGKVVYSFTNGQGTHTQRYRKKLDGVLDAGLDILLFSIDIGKPGTVEERRRNMDYNQVLSNLGYFVQTRDEKKACTTVGISATITPETIEDLDASMARFKEHGVQFVLISPLVTTKNCTDAGIYREHDVFSIEEMEELEQKIQEASKKHSLPAYLSVKLCASAGSCTLLRHVYAIPTEDGKYGRKICHNWHTGGPTFASDAAYATKMRELDKSFRAFVAGDSNASLGECEGCIVPYVTKKQQEEK